MQREICSAIQGLYEMKEKFFLSGVAACFWVTGIWNAFLNQPASAVALLAAGFICLFFMYMPNFKRFKAFHLEAEMRDKIEEVTDVLEKLKALLSPIAELLFTTVAREGRMGSRLSNRESYQLMERIETELQSIGMTDKEITKTKKDWHRFNMMDLFFPIYRDLQKVLLEKQAAQGKVTGSFKTIGDHNRAEFEAERQKASEISVEEERLRGFLKPREMGVAAQRIRDFIHDSKCLSDDEKKAIISRNQDYINDLEFYGKNLKFRRLDAWFGEEET